MWDISKLLNLTIRRKYFNLIFYLIALSATISCNNREKESLKDKIREWEGKEIVFPQTAVFTIQNGDTVCFPNSQYSYKVLTYVDTADCTSCRLQLSRWARLITKFDSLAVEPVEFLFYIHSNNHSEIANILKRDRFNYPICLDNDDSLNIINCFPKDYTLQTFLLDKNNRVIAIGNPITNLEIKKLYTEIVKNGNKKIRSNSTRVACNTNTYNYGDIRVGNVYTSCFKLYNVGGMPLEITDVAVSCDCINVDYPRQPIRMGDAAVVKVDYKANMPKEFEETIQLQCNSNLKYISFEIRGNVI